MRTAGPNPCVGQRARRARRLRALAFGLAFAAVLVLAFGASLLTVTSGGSIKPAGGSDSFGEMSAGALGGAQRLLKAGEAGCLDATLPPAALVVEVAAGSLDCAAARNALAVASAPAPSPSLRL